MPLTPQGFVSKWNRAEARSQICIINAPAGWIWRKRLDEAVFAAYGRSSNLSDEEILEKLLSLNLERAKK